MAKLLYKLEITGIITVKTGLHIGGSDVDLAIGGIDSEVAKNKSDGKPYIPGSSLSGKLRNLIAKEKGYKYLNFNAADKANEAHKNNWDREFLALLFAGNGFNADCRNTGGRYIDLSNNKINSDFTLATSTRLLIRDDFMCDPDSLLENILEDKAENTINRNTGEATPRHIERVVRGTEFELNMTLDIFEHDDVVQLLETLHLGINLLNHDYLGGMGSRGSGSVEIKINGIKKLVFSGGTITYSAFNKYTFTQA